MGEMVSTIYMEIVSKYPDFLCTDTTFSIGFVDPVYTDALDIRAVGFSGTLVDSSFTATVYDPRTNIKEGISAFFGYINGSSYISDLCFYEEDGVEIYGKILSSLGMFKVQHIKELENLRFYSPNLSAHVDYEAGYQAGVNDNTLYQDGYDKSFELGEKQGFDEGFIKGQTNDPYDLGDFLFSIIDAPFRIIRESLNFEFMGYDVSNLVLFVITAFLVIFVVKKIKGA